MRILFLAPALALACHAQWNLVGDARQLGPGVRLTRARNDLGGAMWRPEKEPFAAGFDTRFRFRISDPGGLDKGADGFAFVIQNHGNQALGGFGGAGGFASGDGIHSGADPGIPFTLAIFFDTHKNDEARDPSGNFLTVAMNGHPEAVLWPPKRLALTKNLPFKLKDGKQHQARILFQPPLLTVYLDDHTAPILSSVVDLRPVLDSEGKAYVGFTASTGGGWANHDILEWDWRPTANSTLSVVTSQVTFAAHGCLPDRNLCTPPEARVTPIEAGRYRIVLPAHQPAGAALPNPRQLPVQLLSATGIVCGASGSSGSPSCSGPHDRIVITTAQGRSTFSIEGIPGPRQGFFELEVALDSSAPPQ
ncbi:MAG: hypothetical protein J0L64_03490 [Acidobacteria bacterium]|nr:hypothetical protein [Acidobacteriota bacterium]